MRIVMVSGSRNREGKTARMVEALLRGAEEAGCECERWYLPELTIERCRQCDLQGWGECRENGTCVIEDDFERVAASVRQADGAVFATPVYFGDLSESMRAFLDRLRRVSFHDHAIPGIRGTVTVGVCVAGGGGGGAPSCSVSLEGILGRTGFQVEDLIPVRRQNMELKERVLEMTGTWLASRIETES